MGLLGNGDWIKFDSNAPANLVDSAGFLVELTHAKRPATYRVYFAEGREVTDITAIHRMTFLPVPHPEEIERYVCEAWRQANGKWQRLIPAPEVK